MRYDKERLDAAYAKVGLLADSTWVSNSNDLYIRANQELWNRECALKGRSENGIPRSVLDTIPNSRLAEYGTYWYNEMRECAYEPTSDYSTAIAQPETDRTITTYVNQEFRNEDLFHSQEVEKLFSILSDTKSKTDDIENRCRNFLKCFEMKEVKPDWFTLLRKPESATKLSTSSDSAESETEVAYETIKVRKEKPRPRPRHPPRGTANNFDELILQMQLHSEEIRSLWDDTNSETELNQLNADVPEFYPKFSPHDEPEVNYEMVPNVQPWLNYGYPLRHSDFDELAALSSDMATLRIAQTTLRPVQQQLPPPPPLSTQLRTKEPPGPVLVPRQTPTPTRRLYSAVLQNQITPAVTAAAVTTIAATTISTDELDELEREAIEQYRPSNESLAKTSEDSIISAKFQELERLALEQYNSASATETSAGAVGGSADNTGNVSTPLHEPPCGGKPNPSIMTSLDDDISTTPIKRESDIKHEQSEVEDDSGSNHSFNSTSSYEQFNCQTCKKDYLDENEFHDHIKTHVQQPKVVLQRVDDPEIKKKAKSHKCGPLKFTVRTTNNNFKIVQPTKTNEDVVDESNYPRVPKLRILLPEQLTDHVFDEKRKSPDKKPSEDFVNKPPSEPVLEKAQENSTNICNGDINRGKMVELHSLPSESQSPSFPIQSPAQPDTANNDDHNNFWNSNQPTEDPLALSQGGEKEAETHNNLLQNFLNDTVNLKEPSINSNETEYISLERLAEKNSPTCPVCRERCLDQKALELHQKATGHYMSRNNSLVSSNNSLIPYGQPALGGGLSSNPLDSLANLPMHQLAQQVNRLQQSGVHQQNVLINIQQFGQPMGQTMPPPQYGRPPDMPHYPGPGQHYQQQQPQHMYGGYHPPPMNHPMYYTPNSGMYPPMSHNTSQPISHQYAPSAPPHPSSRMMPPRAPPPQQRMAPPPPPTNQMRPRARMPMQRASAPRMMGPRSTATNNSQGGMPRPNMPRPNMPRPNMPQQVRPQRRPAPAAAPTDAAKRKRMDVFLPDTNDNDECSVISVQQCNDGLPVIKNVQGAASGPHGSHSETDPIVHLTDSITLSVRNPKEPPVVHQKKNEAKAVANILATRGITVTPAAKSGNSSSSSSSGEQKSTSPPVAINLNSAVSIIPTARGNNSNNQQKESSSRPPRPPTVDLTDDDPNQMQSSPKSSSTAATVSKRTLPHHCDLCPAQYPTLQSLMQHRKSYHKIVGQNELGVPVIDLKQANVLNKLASIGIHSYIPLPQLGNGTGNFALPIVSVNAAKNPNICNLGALGSGAVLPLGPLRHLASSPNSKQ